MEKKKSSYRIIGIDPGTRVTGYAIIEVSDCAISPIDFGCIRPPAKNILSDRYLIISKGIKLLLDKFLPSELALETQFFHKNPQSALKLGIAFGVALIAAKEREMSIFGYSPKEVKSAIVGTGKAAKDQVQQAVKCFLNLKSIPEPKDAADALAIAICHAVQKKDILKTINPKKQL